MLPVNTTHLNHLTDECIGGECTVLEHMNMLQATLLMLLLHVEMYLKQVWKIEHKNIQLRFYASIYFNQYRQTLP